MSEEPKVWTPEELREVCGLLYGYGWQKIFSHAIESHCRRKFPQARIARWYLDKDARPIPDWLQPELKAILTEIHRMGIIRLDEAKHLIDQH